METRRGQIIAIVALAVLMVIAISLLTYGMVTDHDALAILGMSITIPMFLALTANLVMLFDWPDKR